MRILALDISSANTGWTAGDTGDRVPVFGSFATPAPGHPSDMGRRYASYRRTLMGLIVEHRPQLLGFLAPFIAMQGGNIKNALSSRMLLGLSAITEEVASTLGLPSVEETDNTVRKEFLGSARGKGKELKEAAFRACHERGWHCANHDESDSAVMWAYLQKRWHGKAAA
jgi:hypothetical protein